VQARHQLRHGVQRVRDAASVPPGVQVLGGAAQAELERGEAAGAHHRAGVVGAPHAAVGADHQVGPEPLALAATKGTSDGLPISSSPSIRNTTLTGSRPSVRK
jgi:hypothetical protein